MITQDQLACQR